MRPRKLSATNLVAKLTIDNITRANGSLKSDFTVSSANTGIFLLYEGDGRTAATQPRIHSRLHV